MDTEFCNCASGTPHNDGYAILAAVRLQQNARLSDGFSFQELQAKLEDAEADLKIAHEENKTAEAYFGEELQKSEDALSSAQEETKEWEEKHENLLREFKDLEAEFATYKAILE